jgi:murein DD-endopeptidase MepM/ murein hydrolase activator NlpD
MRLRNNTVIIIILIIMLAAAYYYFTGRPLGSIFRRRPVLRMDPKGDGRYKSSRSGGSRAHNGLDFVCIPGEEVLSPIAGKIIRETQVYGNDPVYRGVVIADNKGWEVKLFYVKVTARVGATVAKGEVVGTCQSIASKYGAPMKDHVHLELRINGKLQNPGWYIDYTTKEPIA